MAKIFETPEQSPITDAELRLVLEIMASSDGQPQTFLDVELRILRNLVGSVAAFDSNHRPFVGALYMCLAHSFLRTNELKFHVVY